MFCNKVALRAGAMVYREEQRTLTSFIRGSITVCMPHLLFDWFGFGCFAYVQLDTDVHVWSNPNHKRL